MRSVSIFQPSQSSSAIPSSIDTIGYCFTHFSKSEGGLTPAVALTAAATNEDRLKALRAGYQFHLPKPVRPAELASAIVSLTSAMRSG